MHGPLPDAFSYVTIIGTCARSGRWKEALRLLQTVRNRREKGLYSIAFNASIRAFAMGGAWEEAKSLIDDGKHCHGSDVRIDFHTFLSVIRTTAASGEWRQALHILHEAEENLGCEHLPTTPKNFLRSGAISVLGRAGQWRRALVLLRRYQATTEKARYATFVIYLFLLIYKLKFLLIAGRPSMLQCCYYSLWQSRTMGSNTTPGRLDAAGGHSTKHCHT